jgi:2-polyprenyl-3-methyl-5-hydroxy-6-metoxy-1,4-benzoquinol methylase
MSLNEETQKSNARPVIFGHRTDIVCVLNMLDSLPIGNGAKVLDVSCGKGALVSELIRRGFDARGTRFDRGLPPIEGVPIDEGVDLVRGLPYPDASFDVVILTDVIEHLEPHMAVVASLARVIKLGGWLILSTVNVMRLDSRLAFLLSGLPKPKRRLMPLDAEATEERGYHNHPVWFPYMYYLLRLHGFELRRLGKSRVKAISRILYPLFLPLVAANTVFRFLIRERRYLQRRGRKPSIELNRELMKWMLSRRMLMDDHLVMLAVKRSDGPATNS